MPGCPGILQNLWYTYKFQCVLVHADNSDELEYWCKFVLVPFFYSHDQLHTFLLLQWMDHL